MATNVVNLDALIPRDDFEVEGEHGQDFRRGDTLRITDLVPGAFFYNTLRKPDFQRETANWAPQKIQDFVKTFLDGDLIPAIILWGAGGGTFVIDGAHRLSALIAWVHDDYGDGAKSRPFFQNDIPPEQLRAAKRTRDLINKVVGSYVEHETAIDQPRSKPEVIERAKRLSSLALQLQWVPAGDVKKAEASFFKINQAATPIDPTELRILRARTSPIAITSRVIVRNATGHKYWSAYSERIQEEMEEIGRETYKILFHPPRDTPIKTLDLPVAGRGYSGQTLPLIFDLVNLANDVKIIDSARISKASPPPEADVDGTETLSFLKNTRRIVYKISGTHPSSLGLHPAIYFYSASGRHQPTAFLAVIELIKTLDKNRQFPIFTKIRNKFENFILDNKSFSNQMTVKFGSGVKGFDKLKGLYIFIIEKLINGHSSKEILENLKSNPEFLFLTPDQTIESSASTRFSRDTKSAAFLKEALKHPLRCRICEGLIHFNSIQFDHIVRKADGGLGIAENAQLTHPYCNSTIKN